MRFSKKLNPLTFQLHRILNVVSVALTVIGLLLVVFTSNLTDSSHRYIGYVLVAFALLQALGGVVRPGKESSIRTVWYIGHAVIGLTSIILGFTNTYLGIELNHFTPVTPLNVLTSIALRAFVVAFVILSAMPNRFPLSEEKAGSANDGSATMDNGGMGNEMGA